jgi:hypothetical protein
LKGWRRRRGHEIKHGTINNGGGEKWEERGRVKKGNEG